MGPSSNRLQIQDNSAVIPIELIILCSAVEIELLYFINTLYGRAMSPITDKRTNVKSGQVSNHPKNKTSSIQRSSIHQ